MMMLTTRKWKSKLHIPDTSTSWRVFQIARTFLLVNISWYFDRADDLNHAFALLNKTVTDFHISDLWNGKFLLYGVTRITPQYYYVVFFACLVLFAVSYTQEKGIHLGERIRSKPIVLRFAIYLILLYALPAFGTLSSSSGGFIYAQF
jgi:hypothetical protein